MIRVCEATKARCIKLYIARSLPCFIVLTMYYLARLFSWVSLLKLISVQHFSFSNAPHTSTLSFLYVRSHYSIRFDQNITLNCITWTSVDSCFKARCKGVCCHGRKLGACQCQADAPAKRARHHNLVASHCSLSSCLCQRCGKERQELAAELTSSLGGAKACIATQPPQHHVLQRWQIRWRLASAK